MKLKLSIAIICLAISSCNETNEIKQIKDVGKIKQITPLVGAFNDAHRSMIETDKYTIFVCDYPTIPINVNSYIINNKYFTWEGQENNERSPILCL